MAQPRAHLLTMLIVAAMTSATNAGSVLLVDDDAPPGDDGRTWQTAYRFLQDALAYAADPMNDVSEIRVARGTHWPDRTKFEPQGTGDRNATFNLVTDVVVKGGYAGLGADDPDERNSTLFETVLSGDLAQDDGPDFANRDDNSVRVLTAAELEAPAALNGVTVSGGNAAGLGGGGILVEDASVSVFGCRFIGNEAKKGGAVEVEDGGFATFTDCTFSGNRAEMRGGAIDVVHNTPTATLDSCLFEFNHSIDGGALFTAEPVWTEDTVFRFNTAEGSGGAIHTSTRSRYQYRRCSFVENSAGLYGGASFHHQDSGEFVYCDFQGNSATNGGAVCVSNSTDVDIVGCTLLYNTASDLGGAGLSIDSSQTFFVNCVVVGNEAEFGGAFAAKATFFIVNCTVVANVAASGAGVFVDGGHATVIENSVLWQNRLDNGATDESAQIFVDDLPNVFDVNYNLIEGLTGGLGGDGNIDGEPLFVDLKGVNLRNLPGSIVNDAGSVFAIADDRADIDMDGDFGEPVAFDFDGRPRSADDPDARDVGLGTPPTDIGAFEFDLFDCNGNRIHDYLEINAGTAFDCNDNGVLDECEIADGSQQDCNGDGVLDVCEFADGLATDCNGNGAPDACDIFDGTSVDCNRNGVPDECEPDCNGNGVADACDIADGASTDCNANGVPDECDIAGGASLDCNGNGLPDECDGGQDCNGNGVLDSCDIAEGASTDCNRDGVPDECQEDCNRNGVADECDIADGTSPDFNDNGIPDECEADCNENGIPDFLDIAFGLSEDCNLNGIPDECETFEDCNANGVFDSCDISDGASEDCNGNGVPDECDIADGTSADRDGDGIPDECAVDCNRNGIPDVVDILTGTSNDCDLSGIPDECENDCNNNGLEDSCDVATTLHIESGKLSPVIFGEPQSLIIPMPPEAVGEVHLTLTASADLGNNSEFIDITINGGYVGTVFVNGADDCPRRADIDELIVDHALFNELVAGDDANITLIPSDSVTATCDDATFVTLVVDYPIEPTSEDRNGNGFPDECETFGDIDHDGLVGTSDLIILLGAWGICPAPPELCPADLSIDGIVGTTDLLILLGNWS